MPNAFASLMLLIWPFVVWRLFMTMPPGRALIWSILGAYLLLPPQPAAFDFPLLPPLDKTSLPLVTAFIITLFFIDKKAEIFPQSRCAKFLILLFILSPIVTVFTNTEPLIFAQTIIRGLNLQDTIAIPIKQFITLSGFLMARHYLQTREDQRDLLIAMVIAGLAYSMPILAEVRLSPQLNNLVYGYYQHLFSQTIRAGGYRPMVFLYHGIWLAFFVMMSLFSALALWRNETNQSRYKFFVASVYLAILLVLCKTWATLVYAVFIGSCIIILPSAMQLRIALFLAMIACLYPILKTIGIVPVEAILAQAESISPDRARSLSFRFFNEDILAARAFEKPLFGWGIWGRNHLHDFISGDITSVSDGYWVIVLGTFGWVGYVANFGLLTLPLMFLWQHLRRLKRETRYQLFRETNFSIRGGARTGSDVTRNEMSPYVGPFALILGTNLVDLLPNATLTTITWIIAGMLLGHAELLTRSFAKPTSNDALTEFGHQRER